MNTETILGILIPFVGTSLGAAMVFVLRKEISANLQKILTGFAAGAMMYVVVEELIPEMSEGKHSNWGTIAFALGFVLMTDRDKAPIMTEQGMHCMGCPYRQMETLEMGRAAHCSDADELVRKLNEWIAGKAAA